MRSNISLIVGWYDHFTITSIYLRVVWALPGKEKEDEVSFFILGSHRLTLAHTAHDEKRLVRLATHSRLQTSESDTQGRWKSQRRRRRRTRQHEANEWRGGIGKRGRELDSVSSVHTDATEDVRTQTNVRMCAWRMCTARNAAFRAVCAFADSPLRWRSFPSLPWHFLTVVLTVFWAWHYLFN